MMAETLILRNQFAHDGRRFALFRLVVLHDQVDLLPEDTAGGIDLFDCHLHTVVLRDTETGIISSQRTKLANLDCVLGKRRADNGQNKTKNQEKQTLHHKRAIISNRRKNCKSALAFRVRR